MMWYDLLRTHKTVEHAMAEVVSAIELGATAVKTDSGTLVNEAIEGTGIKPFNGTP